MKRDLDLVRKILITIEGKPTLDPVSVEIEGHEFEEIAFHLLLLKEAGFIDAIISQDETDEIINVFVSRLTWSGCEFLDLARNDTIWSKSKSTLKEKAVSVSVTIFTELLGRTLRSTLGLV